MPSTFAPDLDQCQGASVPVVPDEVMGLTEIAAYLGVSRQRVHQLSQAPDFPQPFARLTMGPVWWTDDIRVWAEETGRL